MEVLSRDAVRAQLIAAVGGSSSKVRHGRRAGVDAEVDWHGLLVRVSLQGTNIGRSVIALATDLGGYHDVAARVPIEKLLEHTATNASVRMVVQAGLVALESTVVWAEVEPARVAEVLRWRLSELYTVAAAWRARLGLPAPGEVRRASGAESNGGDAGEAVAMTLAALKRAVRVPPDLAVLVAAVAFGVAGADGVITPAERDKLRAWLAEVPAFAGLDFQRVVRAIASLASDPAKTLMESARRLDASARLLAWALANDMAFADGFASDDERRYLTDVATVFKLDADAIAPLSAEAQQRALHRETLAPDAPPPSRDHGV